MSLEEAIKENTAAINALCEMMQKFKPVKKESSTEETAKVEAQEEVEAAEPKAEKPKAEKPKAEKPKAVALADIQEVAKRIILAGGEFKERAKEAIEECAGAGAKISGLPKHPEAEEVMARVFDALNAIAKDLDEEEV